ncbi:hypothetical protein CFOL_v3_28479, partial [Cephalotus follicularis]
FGITNSSGCYFGYGNEEDQEHLWFQCPYSREVWNKCLINCNVVRTILPLDQEISWDQNHMKGKGFHIWIRRLALNATVYHLWLERNRRVFRNDYKPKENIIKAIR